MKPENPASFIASVGSATPPCAVTQEQALALSREHYATVLQERSLVLLAQFLWHPSIKKRYIAVDNIAEVPLLKTESADERIARFTRWSVQLAAQAARKALDSAGIAACEVSSLIVNTCTGYICPGISTYLIGELGLDKGVRAFDLVGSGCGGALPNLQMGDSLVRRYGGVSLCVAVEICTATFQMGDDPSLLVSNAIFGDGAAAAVTWDRPKGLGIVDIRGEYAPQCRDDVRYVHKNGALHNRLTPRLPRLITTLVPPLIDRLLADNGLSRANVEHWALHPGGDKILGGLIRELALTPQQQEASVGVLRDYGNMSSPTALFVLERLMQQGIDKGQHCLVAAYGAGLSMHACLLRAA
ncbi:MAG TPA: 3-oxoacyl-[acyl-carrier-protein] synthase III C-terminal domain-containing protein [Chitinivibrionales bacterium]|jgi:predicted naringenin-chalcone synthase|nr:3-oxoacyl-[acyl-carrier-protein] synthase III C-terminal domain-containing protein [Chitinivibrionales bacterium]